MSTILIVDDDASWRAICVRTLVQAGFEVIEAQDGEAAIEGCRKREPQLVITDIFMPEQDGLGILQALRTAPNKPKILAMSGSGWGGHVDYLKLASKLGADKVLRKPFAAATLLEAVGE